MDVGAFLDCHDRLWENTPGLHGCLVSVASGRLSIVHLLLLWLTGIPPSPYSVHLHVILTHLRTTTMASRSSSTKSRGSRKRRNSGKSLSASAPVSADNDQPQAIKRENSPPSPFPDSSDNDTQIVNLENASNPVLQPKQKDDDTSIESDLSEYQFCNASLSSVDDATRETADSSQAPHASPQHLNRHLGFNIGDKYTHKVRLFRIPNYSISNGSVICNQGESTGQVNNVQRVLIEYDRTGWAKLYDLVRQFDKDRVEDIRDDIDTLLVFVSSRVLRANFLT